MGKAEFEKWRADLENRANAAAEKDPAVRLQAIEQRFRAIAERILSEGGKLDAARFERSFGVVKEAVEGNNGAYGEGAVENALGKLEEMLDEMAQ